MNRSDMNLSLSSDTFSMLKEQFDRILNNTIGNMQMRGAKDATITLKLMVSTEDAIRTTPAGAIDVIVPKFKHDISSVMQVKDKASGELVGDYQLVWDEDEEKYVMREIDNGQMDLFDDETGRAGRVNPEDVVVISGELPPPSDEQETAETLEEAPADGQKTGHDECTPFDWLAQFIGDTLCVRETMGFLTVRSSKNKVVLSSGVNPDMPFYCAEEKLRPHVGHPLVCRGYGNDELAVISIQCADCQEHVFVMAAPGVIADPGVIEEEIAMAFGDGENWNDPENGYSYDEPEG